jgi:hypothetical protein
MKRLVSKAEFSSPEFSSHKSSKISKISAKLKETNNIPLKMVMNTSM